jgi:hypothetical protein
VTVGRRPGRGHIRRKKLRQRDEFQKRYKAWYRGHFTHGWGQAWKPKTAYPLFCHALRALGGRVNANVYRCEFTDTFKQLGPMHWHTGRKPTNAQEHT